MKRTMMALSACLLLDLICLPHSATAQTCNKAIVATTPEANFTIHDNGTVTHKTTGLMWMRCSLGQSWDGKSCSGEAAGHSWGAALQTAERSRFAGHADWRLPNKNELASIVEESCTSPALNARIFPGIPPSYFWSSSPYAGIAQGAWSIDFAYGSINATVKSGSINVLLVRGGRDL